MVDFADATKRLGVLGLSYIFVYLWSICVFTYHQSKGMELCLLVSVVHSSFCCCAEHAPWCESLSTHMPTGADCFRSAWWFSCTVCFILYASPVNAMLSHNWGLL